MTGDRIGLRVMVVDDHAIVRQGIADVLAAAAEVDIVALATGGEDALRLVGEARPDVVLMDLSMPGLDGAESTRRLLAVDPKIRVVMLTSFSEPHHVTDAIDAGAVGYVLKDADPGEIVAAVRAAARGDSPFSPRAARALLQRRAERRSGEELTPRELEVLALVGKGLANKQISRRLGISEKTVKAHLSSVFQRIGVSDRTSP